MSRKTKIKTMLAGMLAVCLLVGSLGMTAFAATGEQTSTIPVTLTIVHTVRSLDVTMPVCMPVSILDGVVLTANNVEIVNNSAYVDVEVTSIRVEGANYDVGNYLDFPEKSEKLIALQINGCPTNGPGELPLTDEAFPVIAAGKDLPIEYRAKVGDTYDVVDLEAAYVIFTLRAVPMADSNS